MARFNRSSRRWRDNLPGRRPESLFHWRGKGVSRLENLADTVFGFSLTLLVVSTSVPDSFEGLQKVFRGFPASVACFALLMIFWNAHYKFFRRYGLEDMTTRILNYGILLLVIFSIYPLKFLFTSWLVQHAGVKSVDEVFFVYRIYGAGLAGIWTLYALLYWHALRKREQLRLDAIEIEYTRLEISGCAINVGTCFVSILLTFVPVLFWSGRPVPDVLVWLPGIIYASLGITMAANGFYFGGRIRRLVPQRGPEPEPDVAPA